MNFKILIAETHKEQFYFIKKTLSCLSDKVTILDTYVKDSNEMYNSIINDKPDIIITNERKPDTPATDIIKKVQSTHNIKQPFFIIISGYPDIVHTINLKNIVAKCIVKPFDYDILPKIIENYISNFT